MGAISRPWYNGSYTMAAKPIKSLELHYTMIEFVIMIVIRAPQFSFIKIIILFNQGAHAQDKKCPRELKMKCGDLKC